MDMKYKGTLTHLNINILDALATFSIILEIDEELFYLLKLR